MISAQDVLRNTAAELGDISQDANAVVAKVALVCKQPDVAAEVRAVFSRLMSMNAEQGRVLAYTIAPSTMDAAHDVAQACGSHKAVPVCRELLRSDVPEDRERGIQMFENLVANLSSGCLDAGLPLNTPNHETVDWSSDTPCAWSAARRDHDTLLALVRGYRFLVEASDAGLQDAGMTRAQLMRKIRGVELRACMEGIAV